jgi:hypothetical protein
LQSFGRFRTRTRLRSRREFSYQTELHSTRAGPSFTAQPRLSLRIVKSAPRVNSIALMEFPKVLDISGKWKWWVMAAVFGFCVAPTFISYQPYLFGFDDSIYLLQSIKVSRAFWSGDIHGLGAMGGIRPPAMALLGLPWGPMASWDAAGRCFITLAAVVSLLAASCLYLLLRVGVKPFYVVAGSVCVVASMGPYPQCPSPISLVENAAAAHFAATAFLADSLFAWTALAAVLLIPYEARTHSPSIRSAVVRGILWGSILSLGAMTKVNFLYFVVLILPTLFLIRLHHGGLRSALAALSAFACCSGPSAFYLIRWGRPIFENAKQSSFGRVADFYYIPLLQFLGTAIRESPGLMLSFVLTVTALIYLVITKRTILWSPDFLAFLIMTGFGIIVLAASNKQVRYAFPAIVALPFLTAVLMSREGVPVRSRPAALAAGFVFCGLLAAGVPTRNRASRQSLLRSDAVLAEAARCNAKRIVLATDSPTLNYGLMELAIEVSTPGALPKPDQVSTLAYQAMSDGPIEEDFHELSQADQVVFQDRDKLSPPFTNLRVSQYERYIRQEGYVPIKVGDDVGVYSMRCTPQISRNSANKSSAMPLALR